MRNNEKKLKSAQSFISWLGIICFILIVGFILIFVYRATQLGWSLSIEPSAYVDFGELLGSVLTPIIALGSVYLLWLTLTLQMEHLILSNESLKNASLTTARLLEHERRLFRLRLLDEMLNRRRDDILNLEDKLSFYVKLPVESDLVAAAYKTMSISHLASLVKANDLESAEAYAKEMFSPERKLLVEERFKQVIDHGIDVLSYHEYDGDVRHIKDILDCLLRISSPFSEYHDEMFNLMSRYDLQGKVTALDRLYSKLDHVRVSADETIIEKLLLKY